MTCLPYAKLFKNDFFNVEIAKYYNSQYGYDLAIKGV